MRKDNKWRNPAAIVECEWLFNRLGDANIRIFDCTTYLHYTDDHPSKPYDVESGFSDYKKNSIPGAAFIDVQNDLSDEDSIYSLTLPNFQRLGESIKQLGIGYPYHVILYARNGMQWATRVWYLLHALGYENVSILNGGFNEWGRLNFPIEPGRKTFAPAEFDLKIKETMFVDKNDILEAINDNKTIIINSLTEDIHLGQSRRYGRPGRIPKSINIPFHTLVDQETGKFKQPKDAYEIFTSNGVTLDKKVINYCGGGIAATLDAFILYQLGFDLFSVYDNSMSEWAMDESLPIETG
tara:strand:+ start:37 stop:924 length:888 start_codon:yes stop_codon:yes gene_type:complete